MMQDLERFLDRAAHANKTLSATRTGFGNLVDLLLGDIEHFLTGAAFRLERIARDFGTSIDQLTQDRFLTNDIGIGDDIGSARRGVSQFDDVTGASNQFRQSLRVEPFTQGHRVVGHALVGQIANRAKDQTMVAAVEIVFGEPIGNAVPGIG